MQPHIRARLGIPDTTKPDEICERSNASIYATDYYSDSHFVRNIRTKEADPLFRKAASDVASVRLAV